MLEHNHHSGDALNALFYDVDVRSPLAGETVHIAGYRSGMVTATGSVPSQLWDGSADRFHSVAVKTLQGCRSTLVFLG